MSNLERLSILPQPDDVTCGPTSLHAVYSYFGIDFDLHHLIEQIEMLEGGGTLAVYLGLHALKQGFKATVYSYNVRIFDPSWYELSSSQILEKLNQQLEFKDGKKFTKTSKAYIEFVENGGILKFDNLEYGIIKQFTDKQLPVIAGLSSTYLYKSKREFETRNNKIIYDDVKGEPTGHFVVVKDINESDVWVADPYGKNPYDQKDLEYRIPVTRFLNSILLGVVTYDANLLVLEK